MWVDQHVFRTKSQYASALALLCLSCASKSEAPRPAAARDPTEWLFTDRVIDELPYVETSSATAIDGSRFRLFVPPVFNDTRVDEATPDLAKISLKHRSGSRVTIQLVEEKFPGTVGSVQGVMRRMQLPVTGSEQQLSTKMEYLRPTIVAAMSDAGGVRVEGLSWWLPEGWLLFLRVEAPPGEPGARLLLIEDLRLLSAGLIAANHRPG